MADLLLQLLCGDDDPILQTYIEKVANTGLRRYQGVVQYGAHAGEELYVHVLNCVFLIDALLPVLNLSVIETKVLFMAVSLHDLNKAPGQQRMTFNRLAVPQNVRAEIETVDFSGFFPEWEDYLEDITELIRAHSGHLHHAGNLLDRTQDKTKLGIERIDELKNLVRAVDVAGLVANFEEQAMKRKFLQELNTFTATQYQLIWHRVSEQRGLLTNVIHNQVAEFLRQKFEAIPLFLYPEGNYYLAPQRAELTISSVDKDSIGQAIELRLQQMKRRDFHKYITPDPMGIRVDREVIEMQVPVEDIWGGVDGKIQSRKYKDQEIVRKQAELKDKMKSLLKKLGEDRAKVEDIANLDLSDISQEHRKQLVSLADTYYVVRDSKLFNDLKTLKKREEGFFEDVTDFTLFLNKVSDDREKAHRKWESLDTDKLLHDECIKLGRLLQALFIFLDEHCTRPLKKKYDKTNQPRPIPSEVAWFHIFKLLDVTEPQSYWVLDRRMVRPYAVAADLNLTYEDVLNKIIDDTRTLLPVWGQADKEADSQIETSSVCEGSAEMKKYVSTAVSFSFDTNRRNNFEENLRTYYRLNHQQCCYCSSASETLLWTSVNAPDAISVQVFSNRLRGGIDLGADKRGHKRSICPICLRQFTVEKLNYKSGGKQSLYLHLMPYTFLTNVFVESLRMQFRMLAQEEVGAVSLELEEAASDARRDRYTLPCKKQIAGGVPIPKFSEVVGNVITLPLNALGGSDTERYLNSTAYALFFHKAFGCKVLLTESSIPILGKDQISDIFLDGVPASLRGLIPVENLNADAVECLWRDYLNLRLTYAELRTPSKENELLSLVESFTRGRQHIFSIVDHLIERKAGKSKKPEATAGAIVRKLAPAVNEVIERGEPMKEDKATSSVVLKSLAQLGWNGRIRGDTLRRNSLLYPLNAIFNQLQRQQNILDLETQRASLVQKLFDYLERIADEDYKPGAGKREKIERFINLFLGDLLGKVYRGNQQKLLADEKDIKAAYLFYIRAEIPQKEKDK